jgi:hypothetical protein
MLLGMEAWASGKWYPVSTSVGWLLRKHSLVNLVLITYQLVIDFFEK